MQDQVVVEVEEVQQEVQGVIQVTIDEEPAQEQQVPEEQTCYRSDWP